MSLAIDVITFSVIAVFAVMAFMRGFLNAVVRLVGCVLAIALAMNYSLPLAKIIYQDYLGERVIDLVAQNIDSISLDDMDSFAEGIKEMSGQLPFGLSQAVSSEISSYSQLWYEAVVDGSKASISLAIAENIVEPVAVSLLRVMVFFVIFGVLMLLVNTLAAILKGVNHLPLIGGVNELLGAVFGAAQGCIYVFVAAALMWFLISAGGGSIGPVTAEVIDETTIFKLFYRSGPWVDVTMKMM